MVDYLVLGLLALNDFLTVWSLRQISFAVARAVEDLDGKIAAAIQSLTSSELQMPEPINPIQAAIGQMLQQRLQTNVVDVPRTSDGKYSGEKVS